MRQREFVLHPLYELQPDIIFTDGVSLQQLVAQVPANGIEKVTI
jgi:2-amino-4-hydroxy-6-hydroxymethyldihydropteridine diphosphokinase